MNPSEPRRDFSVPVRIELWRAGGRRCEEFAVNASPGGLCIHASKALRVGEQVRVVFTIPPEGPRVDAPARVVWSTRREEEEPETAPGGAEAEREHFWETGLHLELGPDAAQALAAWASQPIDRRR